MVLENFIKYSTYTLAVIAIFLVAFIGWDMTHH
jgi:hypothetical protein